MKYKEKCADMLNGIFAFAIYDVSENSIFLCRDKIGYHLIASFIRANEQTTGNYLPYSPSSRFSHDLSWLHDTEFADLWMGDLYEAV